MKKIIIPFLCLALMGCFLTMSAQTSKSKKTATTSKKALTTADANNIIIYSNSVSTFLSDYLDTSMMGSFYNNVMTGLSERGKKNGKTTLYDPFVYGSNDTKFDEVLERYTSYESRNGLTDPGNPPAIIGSENVEFMKSKWNELQVKYAEVLVNHDKVCEYLDSELELRNPSDEAALMTSLDTYKQSVMNTFSVINDLYERIDILGDIAEEVTLAKHPLKNEILDMRRILRLTSKFQKTLNSIETPEQAKNIDNFDKFKASISEYINKYADYNPEQAATPQIKTMKYNVVNFNKSVKKFETDMNNYIPKISDQESLNLAKYSIKTDLELMISDFGSLINSNNNY